ncbi:Zn-ribbon domain-containing OB-fold protein [Nocardia brevicatena]|uniref:Zn-ribbon domain-containing OB-fold protein n=1 Tax=Nocardia brevicatena TaxID=37327 RepID=UPI00031D1A96|nr:OB-fold domain-containing protein [Nocardia brevicatena]
MPQRLVDPTLFVGDIDPGSGTAPALCGSRCGECATVTFPAQTACPRCGHAEMRTYELPREGTLWTFTVQGFEPKPPYRTDGPFTPYGVGYIDLGDVLVESRLTENDPQRLHDTDRVELQLVPAFTDPDGTTVLTFAFAPIAGTGSDTDGQELR